MRSEIHLLMQYTNDFDPAIGLLAIENEMRTGSKFAVSRAYCTRILTRIFIAQQFKTGIANIARIFLRLVHAPSVCCIVPDAVYISDCLRRIYQVLHLA